MQTLLFLADSSTAAAGGILAFLTLGAAIFGIIYSILLFFVPFMLWGCLRRLTDIRDILAGQPSRAGNLGIVKSHSEKSSTVPERTDVRELKRVMRDFEKAE
jgi:hypothetical protein